MTINKLKKEIKNYWNSYPCGIQQSGVQPGLKEFSREYFENIENHRYSTEPEIYSFAQFSRSYGKKVLEVGVGMGTDFLQWIRSGAETYGIDFSEKSINITKNRLKIYGLVAKELKVADCENIPYPDNFFDLVYSWGVIHHTPNPIRALDEIIRVTKPMGKCKIMIYNRHSLCAFYLWIKRCLFKGKFYRNFAWAIANYMESPGTKAFSRKEMLKILKERNIEEIKIETDVNKLRSLKKGKSFLKFLAKCLAIIFGYKNIGWFMTIQFNKRSGL